MKAILLLSAILLAGCGTLDGKLDNRVACTAGKDKAYVVSEWGPVGITGRLHPYDAMVVCSR